MLPDGMFFNETVTTEAIVPNLPVDRDEVKVGTSATIEIFFWDPVANAFSATGTEIEAPGGFIGVLHAKAKITTATTANVRIL